MEQPEIYSDIKEFNRLTKEARELEPIVEAYDSYLSCQDDIAAAASVAAVRTAVGNVFFTVEGDTAVAAVACLHI